MEEQTNTCTCTLQNAQCDEGRRLLAKRREAWDAWVRVAGTPRGEYGFRETYKEAEQAYENHVRHAREQQ